MAELRLRLAEVEEARALELVAAVRELLLEPSRRQDQQLLVAGAATLKALDAYHRSRRIVVERRQFDLPPASLPTRATRSLFLAPPERPIEETIPEPLVRDLGDYRNDLRSYLDLWWHVVTLEGRPVRPCCEELDAEVAAVLTERLEKPQDLTIGLATPFSDLEYRIESDPDRCHPADGTPYRFAGLEGQECRRRSREALERIVGACAANRLDVLCFPELTLDNDSLRDLATLLAAENDNDYPALVVAGSFHLPGDNCWLNRCTVLDGRGKPLFRQDKCVAFKLPPARARELGEVGRQLLGIDERGGYEDIDVSTELRMIDSPLGRLAMPICLDYCGDELTDLVVASGVNLFLVPAMTERMRPFHDQAVFLGGRTRAVSFAVNSAWLLKRLGKDEEEVENELLVMGYLPRKGGLRTTADRAEDAGDLHLFTIGVLSGLV